VYRTLDSVAGANTFLWVVWNALEPIRGGSTDLPLMQCSSMCSVLAAGRVFVHGLGNITTGMISHLRGNERRWEGFMLR